MRVRLKSEIFASGKSQRAIAAKCGIPENKFSEIVRGWTDPSDRECIAIADALGKPVEELFERAQLGEPAPAA